MSSHPITKSVTCFIFSGMLSGWACRAPCCSYSLMNAHHLKPSSWKVNYLKVISLHCIIWLRGILGSLDLLRHSLHIASGFPVLWVWVPVPSFSVFRALLILLFDITLLSGPSQSANSEPDPFKRRPVVPKDSEHMLPWELFTRKKNTQKK